jgi:hypothetical protein
MAKRADREREKTNAELRFERDRHRRALTERLEMTEDEAFLHLVWNVEALQSGREAHIDEGIYFPDDARTQEIGAGNYLPPWDLELVVNERLVARPFPRYRAGRLRIDTCRNFQTVGYTVHLARQVADCQIGLMLKQMDVFREMARIGHRQFEWQRGFSNGPQLYRWHYLFGGPKARAEFEARHGLSTPDFTQFAVVLHNLFGRYAAGPVGALPGLVRLPEATVQAALAMMAASIDAARTSARNIRKSRVDINYQASQLRMTPVISFDGGQTLRAPLPDLLLVRATEGLYYDLVGARGDVRNEVSDRFETYTRDFLNAALPDFQAKPALAYRWRGQPVHGPDVLLHDGDRLVAAIECKARKMNLAARYGEAYPGVGEGLTELAKGVYQLWKFVSHVRRGLIQGSGYAPETAMVLLTLDNWTTLSPKLQDEIVAAACAIAREEDPEITEADQRRVVFASIEDIELTLQNADAPLFEELLRRATEVDRFLGWTLRGLLEEGEMLPPRPYPLGGRLGEVLPWFGEIMRRASAAEGGDGGR